MVKTTSIAVPAQSRFVKPCAVCPMFESWSLMVLFVILWARPPRLSECLTLQCPSRWGRSKAHRAPRGHRFTNPFAEIKNTTPHPARHSTTAPGGLHYSPARLPLRPRFVPPPRWPFVRPSGSLAAGGFGGQWPARGQAFAAGGFGGARGAGAGRVPCWLRGLVGQACRGLPFLRGSDILSDVYKCNCQL